MSRPGPRYLLTANLFAVPFGLCGLAQCWTAAHDLGITPMWPAAAVWILGAVAWLMVAVAFFSRRHTVRALNRELADPTSGPFVALLPIAPMMLGAALAKVAPPVGHAVFWIALVITVAVGGWLSGQWIVSGAPLVRWHPGYLLPTVGGGLIASAIAARLGHHALAQVLFGYGLFSWIVLGTVVFTRLFTQPALPLLLQSTLAIELAPPAVAGQAWFELNGGRADPVALLLAGYGVLMALTQLRLFPLYRAIPFGPPWWGFSFPYAAAVAYLIRWLAAENASAPAFSTGLLLTVITASIGYLLLRSVIAISRHRFSPTVVSPIERTVRRAFDRRRCRHVR